MSEQVGMVNVYTCPKGHRIVTKNLADGVTPFMMGCRGPGGRCKEMARSSFYQVDQDQRPTHVWEKIVPTFDECRQEVAGKMKGHASEQIDRVTREMLEHYRRGGLHLRRATVRDLKMFGKALRGG